MSGPAVFLDRDGVLNAGVVEGDATRAPRSLDELRVVEGAGDGVARLRRAGYLTIVVTNQPDVARGRLDPATAVAIDDQVRARTGVDMSLACWHDNSDGCDCRKPLPGLLTGAARDHDLDLRRSWMVGDRWVDIAAGRSAGTRTVLIETDSSWRPTSAGRPPADLRPSFVALDLAGAVDHILSRDPDGAIRRPAEEAS